MIDLEEHAGYLYDKNCQKYSNGNPTDLSFLLGGRTSYGGWYGYWTRYGNQIGEVSVCPHRSALPRWRSPHVRPRIFVDGIRAKAKMVEPHIYEYGEYPQTVADDKTSNDLENMYHDGSLQQTGKVYTFDANNLEDYNLAFRPNQHKEFEYNGERYIRVFGRPFEDPNYGECKLSNGKIAESGVPYWVHVEPIQWIEEARNVNNNIWISKRCLLSGLQFDTKEYHFDCSDFDRTWMYRYLNTYFANEMDPLGLTATRANTTGNTITKTAKKTSAKSNKPAPKPSVKAAPVEDAFVEEPEPVNSYFEEPEYEEPEYMNPEYEEPKYDEYAQEKRSIDRRKRYGIEVVEEPMSVKDQIDFCIQNGMSFMLHGPSGIGKSQRVKEIDPDLTSITLCNGILPEDVIGKTIYPNGVGGEGSAEGVYVPPKWYTDLCKKCTTEPDKKHVLFIDEVTNARETTQSLIYHVALEKSIAQGVGKLPDNAVVVLAGNSKEESGASYNMPAPLFRRLSHIYLDIDIQDWLEWGSEKSKKHPEDPNRMNIHPLVSSFVATYGKKVFYSEYDEENPEKFALDPRKWEKVSDKIYANNGVMRREILEADIGPELSANLLAYAKNPPLSLEDIIEGDYSQYDIPRDRDAKLALTLSLRYADSKQVGKVRQFVNTYLGAENRAIFDSVWAGKDDAKVLQLANMQKNGGR